MDKVKKNIVLEFKAIGDSYEENVMECYASTFGGPPDRTGDIIVRGAFSDMISIIKTEGLVFLDSHSNTCSNVLGAVFDAVEDQHGFRVKIKLADTPDVQNIKQKVKQGFIRKLSIGFYVLDADMIEHPNWGSVRLIKKIELIEISLVPIPANDRAVVLSVKQEPETTMTVPIGDLIDPETSAKLDVMVAETEAPVQQTQADGSVVVEKAPETAPTVAVVGESGPEVFLEAPVGTEFVVIDLVSIELQKQLELECLILEEHIKILELQKHLLEKGENNNG